MGKSTISMAIFNSYVKLPEGNFLGFQQSYWDFEEALVSKTRRGFSLNVRRGGTVL